MIWRCLVALLAFAIASCSSSGERLAPMPAASESGYRVGPGDEIRVSVFGLDQVANTYIVGDDGMVSLPLVEPVPASGKTVREVEAAIAAAVLQRKLVLAPSVTVQIQKYRPFYILGEVQRPGQYAFVPGMSVLSAVSIAGGYTFRADKKRMVITRGTVKGRAGDATPVQPGDTITIAERWF